MGWEVSADTPTEVFPGVLMFAGISFCRISLCLSSHMRGNRCSWKHLCMDVLEARCWEKGANFGGRCWSKEESWAVLSKLRSHKVFSRKCLDFLFLWDWALAVTEARDVLIWFQCFKMQISALSLYSWLFCLSYWGPEIAIQCVSVGECPKKLSH